MSILDEDSPEYHQFVTLLQSTPIYSSLAWVTPAHAARVFCGSAILAVIFNFLAINADNHFQDICAFLFMVALAVTVLSGIFGVVSWLYDRSISGEKNRILARWGLHFAIFALLFIMGGAILRSFPLK